MKFEEMLPHLKDGKKAYRENWNGIQLGKVMYIYIPPIESENVFPYIELTIGSNPPTFWKGWLPSVADIFADDWEIVEENNLEDLEIMELPPDGVALEED